MAIFNSYVKLPEGILLVNNFPTSRAPGIPGPFLDPTLARSEASLRLQTSVGRGHPYVDEIAKSLVQVTPITMLHDTYNYSIT